MVTTKSTIAPVPVAFLAATLSVLPVVAKEAKIVVSHTEGTNSDAFDMLVSQLHKRSNNAAIVSSLISKAFASESEDYTVKINQVLAADEDWSEYYNPSSRLNETHTSSAQQCYSNCYSECHSSRGWR